jgi:uncharacterized protein (TIGR03663 family)
MRIDAPSNSTAEAAPEVFRQARSWFANTVNADRSLWLIVGTAAVLRVLLLGIKPPHFDEGINGWFVDQMVKTGFYRYDPTNYHGPLHFYILFLSQTLFGRNVWALRMPVVLGSIFCVYLTTRFEPLIGRTTARLAAVAMAVSPAFVFYGRYSIHEVWLLLFSMLFVLGLLGLRRFGTATYLWCTTMGLTGMILTKETYIIHVGCAAIAAVVLLVSHAITPLPDFKPARQRWAYLDLAVASATAIALIVFFYSGTFFNWDGLKGLYQSFDAWFKTGSNGNGHEKRPYYWLMLIARYEAPVLAGLIMCGLCQQLKSFALRYLAIYGVGTLAAYSIVAYKTPWCIISIVWPFLFLFAAMLPLAPLRFSRNTNMFIGAGIVLVAIATAIYVTLTKFDQSWPWVTIGGTALVLFALRSMRVTRGLVGILVLLSLGWTISLNYFRCTTDTEPYVYVQTYNDIFKLTRPLEKLAQSDKRTYQLVGHLIRTSAYPFPWILGDFPNVGYYEHDNLPTPLDGDFLIVQEDKVTEVESKLQKTYFREPLRIRPYQDTSQLYLRAKVFQKLFPGRTPEFVGRGRDE